MGWDFQILQMVLDAPHDIAIQLQQKLSLVENLVINRPF
jgi:hypothetical protein